MSLGRIAVDGMSVVVDNTTTVPPETVVLTIVVAPPTATKTKAEGKLVLRQNDQSETIKAIPKIPGSPPVDYPISFKCAVLSAGQTKVKAQ